MGIDDKARHQGENVKGKAKEAVGRARSDKPLKEEGKRDQRRSQFKKAGENIKKAFKK